MDLNALLDPMHFASFLGGTAVGAAGKYLSDLFTDQRKRKEATRREREEFEKIRLKMPALLAEMKADLLANSASHLREVVILPSKVTAFNHGEPRLVYYESKHQAVQNQMNILVSEGHVEIVKAQGHPIYRFREKFVDHLLRAA